ncbi:MAG TPA: AmmeMemoRadiSam system radical SAM enzyme [Candidatus Sulfopaludibacter sp.]|jgi:pyruvate formate lyase activating enzyme|nr:AmmeMemoRadiSam system radical SAM enzyme [Candidatus Sulfopaludibacter sp.]
MASLAEQLATQVRESKLHRALEGGRVQCFACGHRCPIPAGFAGVCKVRYNRGGQLYAPHGYVNAAFCDPIEKKPFFHAMPGTRAFSFGMLGCDLHCGYCQNWVSSQALRDFRSSLDFQQVTAKQLVKLALRQGASSLISTYNEPLITAEWAVEVFQAAKQAGLTTGFVSNGNATPEVLEYIRPWVDLYKVDLKSFNDRNYHELGGRIAPILDSIKRIHEMGFWLEIVTLVIPGFNDSDEELAQIAAFLAAISRDIPWHVTAFHKDYKMTGPEDTPASTLIRAAGIGRAAGLRYVYAGNLPGATEHLEDTPCPGCGTAVIRREGFRVIANRVDGTGKCPQCATAIPGVWSAAPDGGRQLRDDLVHIRCG